MEKQFEDSFRCFVVMVILLITSPMMKIGQAGGVPGFLTGPV